jgi:hypothetical protein
MSHIWAGTSLELDLAEAGPRHPHWHGVCFLRLPWPTLEHAPVSPVSSAPGRRLTGTGYTRIIHAHLSVVGDASAEPLSEDPCCRLQVPLGLELDIWTLDTPHCGTSATLEFRFRDDPALPCAS